MQLGWVDNVLNSSINKRIIFISPKPIGHINKIGAFLYGLFFQNGKDELFHPKHYDRTRKLLDIMHNNRKRKSMIVVAGRVNGTYINDIYHKNLNKPLALQLVSSGITRLPKGYHDLHLRLGNWIQQKLVIYSMKNTNIINKRNISNNNNFGIIKKDKVNNHYIKCYNGIVCSCLNK